MISRGQPWARVSLQPAITVPAMVNVEERLTVCSSIAFPSAHIEVCAGYMLDIVSTTVSKSLAVPGNVPT
jgi:hypothetical protein